MAARIFFFGNLRTPFMKNDRDILTEDYDVFTYDMAQYANMGKIWNAQHILNSLFCAKEIWGADLVWGWIADYPALPQFVLAKLFGKPIVFHIGGWEVYNAPEINHGNQLNPVRGWVTRQIMKHSTRCIVPSAEYVKVISKTVPQCRPAVINNYIESNLFAGGIPEKERLCVTSLCASSAGRVKGIPVFEKAAELLKPEGIDFLVTMGLKRQDYINTLRRAKVYCQLSYLESFGVSLVEAMACGCVPVVSNRDALPWIIQDTGIVVPYGNAEATAEAIRKAMNMDGLPARERARYFSRDKKKAEVNKLIAEILE